MSVDSTYEAPAFGARRGGHAANGDAAPLTSARKRRSRIAFAAIGAFALVVTGVVAYTLLRPKASATATYSTAVASRQTIAVVVSGTGTTVVKDAVTVNPQISGTVKKLYMSLGSSVTAGDRLYTISSDDVQTAYLQAKASLLQSKQGVSQAEQSKQQAQNQLYQAKTSQIAAQQSLDALESQPSTTPGIADKIVIAKRDLKSAKKSVSAARASVVSAQTGIDVAEANYTTTEKSYADAKSARSDTVITAPIDGVVTALPIKVGSDVTGGTTSSSSGSGSSSSSGGTSSSSSSSSNSGSSITISDMGTLQAEVSVSEADITSVAIGQSATLSVDAISGTEFSGKVKSISPNGTSSSGVVNYTVTLSLKPHDARLRPDMTVTADIATTIADNVIAVPMAAVKTNNGAKYVVVASPNGQTTNQTVTTGVSDDTYTQIKSGLTEGTAVVTGSVSSGSSSSSSSSSSHSSSGFMMGGGPPSGGPGGN
jgi:membrane fusion protein, macrolide-specific efflux system